MDNRRLILLLVLSFSLIMIWDAWQKQGQSKPSPVAMVPEVSSAKNSGTVPSLTSHMDRAVTTVAPSNVASESKIAIVKTDLFVAEFSSHGGDLIRLELIQHPETGDQAKRFILFDNGEKHVYLAQSGVLGDGMPNHKSDWNFISGNHSLKEGENRLELGMDAKLASGAIVRKVFIFHRGSYQIDIRYDGLPENKHVYYQLTRDGKPAEAVASALMMGVSTFTGPAVFTDAGKYQKVEFADILNGKAKFVQRAEDGWLALVQHYFVAAWLPVVGVPREFYMRSVGSDLFSTGVIVPVSPDGHSAMVLYAGPQEQKKLTGIAPGFDLVVDYGWLTVIAAPLFWILAAIHELSGNWGWAIIGLTVMLKALFFPLSAASYRSMAKMRVLTPKLMKLKDMYGEDKARLNQEMMDLYKREKVNPLGGCLPVLVQIPVFIALYWVLLGAVEMRNAPWFGWITDLSVKDPYFILPLIMGATMFIQTRLNPAPPDPIQAKIMLFMPILFTGMFLFFPAGLVLYWTVNNVLSIIQQWHITRVVEAGISKT